MLSLMRTNIGGINNKHENKANGRRNPARLTEFADFSTLPAFPF